MPTSKRRKSAAKKLLKEPILDGIVSDATDAVLLQESYEELKPWISAHFKRNLQSLIKSFHDG